MWRLEAGQGAGQATNTGLPHSDLTWLTQRTHYTQEEIHILHNGQ